MVIPWDLKKGVRGHVQKTSAKFPWFLTPSLPLSELVIFAYTPPVLETSYLGSPPPYYVPNPAFKRRICCIALLYDFHLSQEKKLLNEALNVGRKELQEWEFWLIDKHGDGFIGPTNMTSESLLSPLPLIIFGQILGYHQCLPICY